MNNDTPADAIRQPTDDNYVTPEGWRNLGRGTGTRPQGVEDDDVVRWRNVGFNKWHTAKASELIWSRGAMHELRTTSLAAQSDVSGFLPRMMNEWCEAVAENWGQGSETHNVARDGVAIVVAALKKPAPSLAAQDGLVEKARKAVERLAHTEMNLSMADWSEISGDILAALSAIKGDKS